MIHYPIPPHRPAAYTNMGHSNGHFPIAEAMAQQVLPDWAEMQLSQATTDQLEAWALCVLDANSLESLLGG